MAISLDSALAKLEREIDGLLTDHRSRLDELQKQVDAIDAQVQRGAIPPPAGAASDWSKRFVDAFQADRKTFESGGRLRFTLPHPALETRTVTRPSTLPSAPSPRIGAAEATPAGALLELIPTLAIDQPAAYVLREDSSSGWQAGMQAETSPKVESTADFVGTLVPVRTLATWVTVSRQALDDLAGLGDFVRARLEWALARKLEEQILSGSGSGENLYGLMVAASTWTAPSGVAYDLFGQLAYAAAAIEQRGYGAPTAVMHPNDALRVQLQRDQNGQYVGTPAGVPRIVRSAAQGSGEFLVGDFSQCVLRVRQGVTIDISGDHADYFAKNLVAIRAEQRVALVIYAPAAFIKGTLATSPA
ncbi:MAG: phage major capsid protein [Bryobacteraceae bacterium]